MPFSFLLKNKKEHKKDHKKEKKKEKKKEHIIEIYNNSDSKSLPEDGWIQHCKNCDIRTCQTFEFKRVETSKTIYIYMVYLCKTCTRKKVIEDEEFIKKLNNYIDFHYLLPS